MTEKAKFKATLEYFAPHVWHWKVEREDGRIVVGHASSMAYCIEQIEEKLNK
jgi:hypothetical protein